MNLRFLIIATIFLSCQNNSGKEVLAEVNGLSLYKEDVMNSIPKLESHNDTLAFINQRAESWMRSSVLLSEAKKSTQSKGIDGLVDQYRNELIIAEFEKDLIQQNLDTMVSDQQILDYIKKENLAIGGSQTMIKVKFGKVKSDQPDLDKVDSWWEDKKWEKIKGYCATFAEICMLKDDWITLTEFKQYFPAKVFPNDVLKKKDYIQKSHGSFEYFLYALDYKEESNIMSAGDNDKVRRLILHNRAKTILKNYKEELYQKSLDNQKIKFYLN